MKKHSLLLMFFVVFMDMIGFGFIIPIMPDYISLFGARQEFLGIVLGIYALGQFIAAPVVGALSDRFGRKPLLLFSIAGTFASLLLLGTARTLTWILISRLLDGLTGGNITVAQSYIADCTSKEDRTKGLGLIGMAFGLGFVLGPLFGGLLVGISLQAPALVAAGIAGLNLIFISLFLPESHPKEKRSTMRKIRLFDPVAFQAVFSVAKSRRYLGVIFFYTLAFNLFETMFSSHSMLAVGLSPKARGLVLAYIGILIALTQGGLAGILSKKFKAVSLLRVSNLLLILSLAAWGFATNLTQLLLAITPASLAAAIQSVQQKGQLSLSASSEHQGAVMGASVSLESLNRIIAPVLGGFLLSRVALWAPGIASAFILIIPMILLLLPIREDDPKPEDSSISGR